MRELVPGIHALDKSKDVDGRDTRAFTPGFAGLCPVVTIVESMLARGSSYFAAGL
jgi:hypothetical protein